jgi:hypothetical protein
MLPNLPANPNYPLLSDAKFIQLADDFDTTSWSPEHIKVELDRNMDIALKSLAVHQAHIDQLAAVGKQTIAQTKAAVNQAHKGSAADKQAALQVSFRAATLLNQIAKQAHEDHQAFDGAWNKFRALNIKLKAPHLPETSAENFIRGREKIMADGKLINVKVAKLKQLTVQADAITKLSATLVSADGKPAQAQLTDEHKAAAEKLEKQLLDQMNKSMGSVKRGLGGGKNIGWFSVEEKLNTLRSVAKPKQVTKQDLASSVNIHVNMLAAVKTYKATIKTMDTLISATVMALPASLQKSKGTTALLAKSMAVRNEAAGVKDEAIKVLAEADKLIAVMKKKVV